MSNKEIIHLLRSVAASLTLTGANTFRIIAYQKAADAVERESQEIYDLWSNGRLSEVEGIGPSLQQHLDEYFKKPEGSYLDKELSKIPATVYELMKAPGIGPKKAYKIVIEFNLLDLKTLVEDIKLVASQNRIAEMEGFGEKSQEDIIRALTIYESRAGEEERMSLPVAFTLAQKMMEYLKLHKNVEDVGTLGSLRRMNATIGDVDVVAVAPEEFGPEIVKYFTAYPDKVSVEAEGDLKGSIITTGGRRIDLRVVEKKRYGAMVQYFTGSKAHNIKLREYGLKKGLSLNEFGMKKVSKDAKERSEKELKEKKVPGDGLKTDYTFDTEEKFYNFLGLDWVPPEIREGTDEIKLAEKHSLPKLVELKDLKGEFHVHSNFPIEPSHDLGADSIEDMAKTALALGYDYLALSEHNPSQKGHTDAQIINLIKQKKEAIENVNKAFKGKIHLFNSMEIDILPDGTLALPDGAFEYLDMAVVSIHSSFKQEASVVTKRILKALSYPKVRVIGHPTGRMLPNRDSVDANWEDVFALCKEKGIALEINSSPERLDLPDSLVKKALKMGNIFVISTDAHAASALHGMLYGISVARRGWCTKNDIMNTKSLDEVKKWLG